MGRNRGLITYRRSQSNLPRTHREQGGKEHRTESRTAVQRTARFRAAQHLEGLGVIQPHVARDRPQIVELEELGEHRSKAGGGPRVAVPETGAGSPRAIRRHLNRAGLEIGVIYLVVAAVALWCYVLIVMGGHGVWWKAAGGAVAPVFLWTGVRIRSALELPPEEDDSRAHAPALVALRLSLVSLAALAVLVITD